MFVAPTNLMAAEWEWQRGEGESPLGDHIAKQDACNDATSHALHDALKKSVGENIISAESLECSSEDTKCKYDRNILSFTGGMVLDTKDKKEKVITYEGGRLCQVGLTAKIGRFAYDPGFDFTLNPNKRTFVNDEKITIAMLTTQDMHYYVFNYLPNMRDKKLGEVYLINDGKTTEGKEKNILTGRVRHCSTLRQANREKFDCSAKPKDGNTEFIIVVGTKEKLQWLPKYSYLGFYQKIYELQTDYRIKTAAYRVFIS